MSSEGIGALQGCPFCGSNVAGIRYKREDGTAFVECGQCFARSGGFQELSMSEHTLCDHAAKEWNTRALVAQEAEIARLKRGINMAMGCLDPMGLDRDAKLAWFRLFDAMEGKEPRAALTRKEG